MIGAAILDGYQRKKDKTVSLRFVTQEKSSHDIMKIDSMTNEFGILYFRTGDGPIEEEETKDADGIDIDSYDTRKTHSQRLRAVMFVLWTQEGEPGEFSDFYKTKMETIIDHYKTKLE